MDTPERVFVDYSRGTFMYDEDVEFENWYRENYRASDTKETAARAAWDYQKERGY